MSRILQKLRFFQKDRNRVDLAKSFKENQHFEEAFDSRDRGRRTVPLGKIVGSVGRYNDFDSKFQIKGHVPTERLERIKKAIRQGKPLDPVKLYQIKDEYYVLDGNHRISAAKEFGWSDILANIVEFIPSKNTLENILFREKAEFDDRTGLPHTIRLTEIGQYHNLLGQIEEHQAYLARHRDHSVQFAEAAQDWYQTIYLPLTAIIKQGCLIDYFPERTIADLYAYISFQQWDKGRKRKYGIGIDRLIPKDMEAFRNKMSEKIASDYPEMKREITTYVLMNVMTGRNERKILEKLFALKEVREVHSVHGSFDFIVKIILTRDLLSSDAEIIGQFIHEQIRQIPGISSTQTLIPGYSKIKDDKEN